MVLRKGGNRRGLVDGITLNFDENYHFKGQIRVLERKVRDDVKKAEKADIFHP